MIVEARTSVYVDVVVGGVHKAITRLPVGVLVHLERMAGCGRPTGGAIAVCEYLDRGDGIVDLRAAAGVVVEAQIPHRTKEAAVLAAVLIVFAVFIDSHRPAGLDMDGGCLVVKIRYIDPVGCPAELSGATVTIFVVVEDDAVEGDVGAVGTSSAPTGIITGIGVTVYKGLSSVLG